MFIIVNTPEPGQLVAESLLFDEHDHHLFSRAFEEDLNTLFRSVEGFEKFNINDYCIPGVECFKEFGVHGSLKWSPEVEKLIRDADLDGVRGGKWNNYLNWVLKKRDLDTAAKQKLILEFILSATDHHETLNFARMRPLGIDESSKKFLQAATESQLKFLALCQKCGIDNRNPKYAKALAAMHDFLKKVPPGVLASAAEASNGVVKTLKNGSVTVLKWAGKAAGVGVVVVILSENGFSAEAAKEIMIELSVAGDLRDGHRLIVVEGGTILIDAVGQAGEVASNRALIDALEQVDRQNLHGRLLRYDLIGSWTERGQEIVRLINEEYDRMVSELRAKRGAAAVEPYDPDLTLLERSRKWWWSLFK